MDLVIPCNKVNVESYSRFSTGKLDEKSLIAQYHNFILYIYIYYIPCKNFEGLYFSKKLNIPCKYILDNYIPLLL